jgi:aryl-alcohol dehydrogenase-like predicted oxidoreductase
VKKELYIATKCKQNLRSTIAETDLIDLGMPFAGHFFLFRPAVLTAIDLSLKRLGVDSIDLYMVCPPPLVSAQLNS